MQGLFASDETRSLHTGAADGRLSEPMSGIVWRERLLGNHQRAALPVFRQQPVGHGAQRAMTVTPVRLRINQRTARLLQIVLGLAMVVVPLACYFLIPPVHAEVQHALGVLTTGDAASLRAYLLSFGIWAPVISLLIMITQAVVAPIPAFLVVFANGLAFGVFWGWLLSLAGQTLAATVCYWIARLLGRDPVEGLVGKFGLETADRWFDRWGVLGVFLIRILPGISFDAISYAAGLTSMRFLPFLLASVAGSAPQLLVYVVLGTYAPGSIWLLTAVSLAIGLAVVVYGLVRTGMSHRRSGAIAKRNDAVAESLAEMTHPIEPPAVNTGVVTTIAPGAGRLGGAEPGG